MVKGKRAWQEREMRMLVEWLEKTYPGARYYTRVRLGRPPAALILPGMTEEELAMVGIWRRWADGVVVLKDRLVLIEAAIRPDPGDISKIELYTYLLPHTPEFSEYAHLPIEKVLLYALEDPVLVKLARDKGIRTVYYSPPWLPEYMAILYPRERRAPLSGGELG